MDKRAEAIREGSSVTPPVPEFDDQDFQIKINSDIIYSNIGATLRKAITGKAMKSYLQSKYDWSDAIFTKIDWTCLESYLKGLSQQVRTNVLKLRYGWQFTRERRNVLNQVEKKISNGKMTAVPSVAAKLILNNTSSISLVNLGYSNLNTELRQQIPNTLQESPTTVPYDSIRPSVSPLPWKSYSFLWGF